MPSCLNPAAALALSALLPLAATAGDGPLPPAAKVAGRTQLEWSVQWWKWAASFERHESPVADRSGAFCAQKQGKAVWFLAGTYGTRRTERECTVPAGVHLFFPLINYIVTPNTQQVADCATVRADAARMTDAPSALVLEVDGKRYSGLAQHRLATVGCFDLGEGNTIAAVPGPAASNGYFVMLPPLPPGKHVIHFGGALPSMLQAVSYTLTVDAQRQAP